MRPSNAIIFALVFVVAYAIVSYIDSGTIYWTGLVGGAVGVIIAFSFIWWFGRRHSDSSG